MSEALNELLARLGSRDIAEFGLLPLVAVLLVALLSSFFVGYLYQTFYRARATGSQVYRAFPLMGISITAIFISVQFSLPLSLGLLGALSIVRFRTPIKEPEEIGFILLVIATSLSAATFNFTFLALVLLAAVVALLIMRSRAARFGVVGGDGLLLLTLPPGAALDDALAALDRHLPAGSIDSLAESDEGVTVSYRFRRLARGDVARVAGAIRDACGRLPGIHFYEGDDL